MEKRRKLRKEIMRQHKKKRKKIREIKLQYHTRPNIGEKFIHEQAIGENLKYLQYL